MKAVSFLSVAFMAASAVAAPFQGEARSVAISTNEVSNSVVARDAVAPVAGQEKRDITDLTSLVSTLTNTQSSLDGPLSSLSTFCPLRASVNQILTTAYR